MKISIYIIPVFIFTIIITCFKNKVNIYDAIVQGAESGLKTIITILPTMIIILAAVGMLRASGALETVVGLMSPLFNKIGVPAEIIPMVLLRPISGSGSFGLLTDYYATYGPDSIIGKLTSVIMASTETTFYTIAVYYSGTGIKDIRRVLPCAIFGDLICIVIACIIVL